MTAIIDEAGFERRERQRAAEALATECAELRAELADLRGALANLRRELDERRRADFEAIEQAVANYSTTFSIRSMR
jgi:chromosome segregation ATPase